MVNKNILHGGKISKEEKGEGFNEENIKGKHAAGVTEIYRARKKKSVCILCSLMLTDRTMFENFTEECKFTLPTTAPTLPLRAS